MGATINPTMTDDIATQILKKLSNLEQGQTELRGDVQTLTEGQAELRGDFKALTDSQTELKVGLSRVEVLLEDTNDRLDATQEVVSSINVAVSHIPQMADDIAELKSDNKAIKLAVTATNRDIKTLDRRVTHLETITAV